MSAILVVDDDNDVASVLIQFLESEGHEVRYAPDGQQGLRMITERFPELICLDVEMPKLNGPDMAYRLIVEDSGRENIPLIVITR